MTVSLLALLAVPLVLPGSGTVQGTAACSLAVGCQAPDQQGWALSDDNPAGGLRALDNLRIAADGAITSVCWWGVYFEFASSADCGPGAGDDFTVSYYEDGCLGVPGALRAGPFHVGAATKTATGATAGSSGFVAAEYRYEATHAAVPVLAGECLWIEIVNETSGSCFWLWSTGDAGDARSVQSGVFGTTPVGIDLAFCVDVPIEPDGCASALAVGYCTAKTNSLGCTPRIEAQLSGVHLVIAAEQVLPAQPGLLFYGVNADASTAFQGGLLCVQPPLVRTPPQVASGSGAPPCTGSYAFDFTAWQESGVDPALAPGAQVWVQFWSRDPADSFGSGLTDALTFELCP